MRNKNFRDLYISCRRESINILFITSCATSLLTVPSSILINEFFFSRGQVFTFLVLGVFFHFVITPVLVGRILASDIKIYYGGIVLKKAFEIASQNETINYSKIRRIADQHGADDFSELDESYPCSIEFFDPPSSERLVRDKLSSWVVDAFLPYNSLSLLDRLLDNEKAEKIKSNLNNADIEIKELLKEHENLAALKRIISTMPHSLDMKKYINKRFLKV